MDEESRVNEIERLRSQVRALEIEARTSQLTGLPNKAQFDADEALGWSGVGAMNMDGLKRLNAFVGHDGADAVLRAIGEALAERDGADVRFYHRSGDEFAARFKNKNIAKALLADIQQELADTKITITGVDSDGAAGTWIYEDPEFHSAPEQLMKPQTPPPPETKPNGSNPGSANPPVMMGLLTGSSKLPPPLTNIKVVVTRPKR